MYTIYSNFVRYTTGFTLVEVKISGTKVTVKRPAPQSPANIRPVDERKGWNEQHTHVKPPRSLLRRILGRKEQ